MRWAAGPLLAAAVLAAVLGPGGPAGAQVEVEEPPLPPVAEEVIGRSVLGRPIGLVRLGEPDAPRRVLVVGAIHGDEAGGRFVADRLVEDREVPPGAQLLLVRSLNPDAVARGSRLNAHGVDLNRNSSYRFGQRQPAGSAFPPGPRAFSEPESRAIRALILRERPAQVVWYHQPLRLVDAPELGAAERARAFAAAVGLPFERLTTRPGSLSAWTNAKVRTGSSFVVELGPGRPAETVLTRHARAVLDLAR